MTLREVVIAYVSGTIVLLSCEGKEYVQEWAGHSNAWERLLHILTVLCWPLTLFVVLPVLTYIAGDDNDDQAEEENDEDSEDSETKE